jgi:hypothetical protein
MPRTPESRRADYWRSALRHAEWAYARHETIRASMPLDAWATPKDAHTQSWATTHAQVAWLLWSARRHVA